jgi:hypothetical protein
LESSRGDFKDENDIPEYEGEGNSDKKWAEWDDEQEYNLLKKLLDDLRGNGGDEQWRGDWYPITLIRDSYFVDYCEDLVSDIGDMPREIPSYIVIDWEKTAENLLVDYSSVDFDGEDYWYR